MSRHRRFNLLAPAALALVAAFVTSGCNVLFVPRKPDPTPSPTPVTAVHRFVDLEARLPDTIGGKPVQKFSLTTDPAAQSPKTLEVLRRLDKTVSDLEIAKGFVTGSDLNLSALRIIGSDAVRAAVAFEQIDEADLESGTTYLPATVAGKRVIVRQTAETTDYMYPLGDTIFVVGGARALVEEALTNIK
jgi:hypothetical protein